MTTSIPSWGIASILATLIGISTLNACNSDSDDRKEATDSGAGGARNTGGKSAGGKSAGTGGVSAAGGAAACTTAIAIPCDGAEDCPTGQRCCGLVGGMPVGYTEFGCFDSCTEMNPEAGAGLGGLGTGLWLELCHEGDICEDTAVQCLTSTYLPSNMSRCYTMGQPPDATIGKAKGEINCGADVCGATEKCCMRGTLTPYCALKAATCDCGSGASDGGGAEGGKADGSASEAGMPDVSAPEAAAPEGGPESGTD